MIAVGTRVDGYAIEQRLGEGASAEVYLARDDALARHVVIKLSRDARADARLEREAALLSRAGQRGLLQIYGRGEHDGRVYLVLEHASGADLAQLMRDGRLARVDALTVARDIAEALGALHDADILHLDVKPANIVVDNGADGARRARLVDLGAATRADDGDSPGEAGSSAGARQGTPAYLAPERASGDDPSSASDVFSLGVVLHELVCGVRPAHGDAPVLAAATPALSPELCEITARCLAAKPAQRPDARQLANALEAELARTRRAFDCPFVGTAPYDTRAAALYFGREDELDQLAEMVRRPGAVAVVGAAGVGKSSLLHAGLAPRLGSTGAWRVLRLSASAQPLLALARVLSRAEQRDAQHDAQRDEQADAIAARAKLLAEAPAMAALMLDALGGAGSSTLLVVDQLERVLDAEPAAARAFLEALSVAGSGDGDTRVVVAARDVALGPLAELGGATLLERVLPLAELPADDITRAITRAAAVCGARFEPPELADKIARDVTAAGSHEALSLLQLTLRALWARRDERAGTMRQADYVTLGGVHGALALLGEQALSTLDDRQRAEARAVLLALLDERGEAQPRARGELEALGDGRVIDTLLRARVISRPRAAGTEGYDADDDTIVLAHPALSTWPELRAWREADALAHALSRELERAATLWHARGERDEELWDAAALAELARIAPPTSPSAAVERFVAASRRRARRRQTLRRGGAGALLLAVLAGVVGASVIASERAREVPARGARSASRDGDGGALDSPARRTLLRRQQRALRRARAAARAGERVLARAYVRRALELGDSAAARVLWWRLRPRPLLARWPLRRAPRALQSSADGRRLALLDAHVTAIFRLSLPSGQRWLLGAQPVGRRLLAALPAAHTLRFVGERALLLAGRDGKLSWFARPKAAPRPLGTASAATRIALDPAARRIVALDVTLDVTRDGAIDKANGAPELRLWQLAGPNGAPRALRPPRLRGPRCAARDVALASASTLLLGCEDGRLLAVPLDSAAAGGKHTKRAEQRVLTRHSTAARLLAVAPDGSRFASASDDGVRLGALPSGRLIAALPLEQPRALAFFPDGTLLAQTSSYSLSIDRDGVVRDGGTTSANAAPLAGKRLAITRGRRGGKPAVELVSSESAAQQRYGPRQGHAGAVRDIAVSADGTVIASVGDEPLLQLWGARGRALRRLPLPSAPTALCIARNRVLVGDRRGRVYAVSLDGRVDGDRALHQKRVTALACLAGDRVVSAGADGRVLLFEATKPQRAARTLLTARSAVLALAVSGGGQVAVAARDGSLTRFSLDAAGKTSAPRTVAARGKLTDTAISADGSFIAAIGPRELVIVSRDGRTHHRLEGSRGARIAFLPDDLANRGALMLVDAAGRRQRIDPTSARQRPPSKPDERWRLTRLVATAHALLGGGRDGTLRRWDWTLAALGRDDERPLEPSTLPRQVIVRNLHVSLHGDVLIARRGKRRARWPLGPGATCVAASPDGWIAVGMLDGSVELRHLTRTQLAPRLPAATTAVSALRFGRRDVLLVARRGGALSLWHVPTRARLYDARLHGTVVRIQSLPQQRGWRLRSELGDALVVDASPLSRSRCELLAEIWRESPFVAAGAALRLRRRPPPAGHSCSKARRAEAHIP